MDYTQKNRWKIGLAIGAAAIAGVSLWYSNVLAHRIQMEERNKIQLWAEAIQRKAHLVKYAKNLFDQIGADERKKVQLWADATKLLASTDVSNTDLSFIFELVRNNENIPVVLADSKGKAISNRNLPDSTRINDTNYVRAQMNIMRAQHTPIEINIYKDQKNYLYYEDSRLFSELKRVLNDLSQSFISEVVRNLASVPVVLTDSTKRNILAHGNIDTIKLARDSTYLKTMISSMEASNTPMVIELGEGGKQYIFYEESALSKELRYYPYLVLGIMGAFVFFSYSLFSTARRAEQNRVWIGLAKETAHQLGTPLSSLMAWVEYLKEKDPSTATELGKDVKRLETITSRFSKIGSSPQLEVQDVSNALQETLDYMKARTSQKVKFALNMAPGINPVAPINAPLFSWVIENLVRNAIDAMSGEGNLTVDISEEDARLNIDISDTGKGMPKSNFKVVFEPGFTTKERGWGLGLSLCKRIIENYHGGRIFVKNSEVNKGTTFRITLKK
jgi:signal transduction histidine kinase